MHARECCPPPDPSGTPAGPQWTAHGHLKSTAGTPHPAQAGATAHDRTARSLHIPNGRSPTGHTSVTNTQTQLV